MGNRMKNFTVGDLLKFIEEHQIPKDVSILYQRIEDIYFEKNNWTTIRKEGEQYHNAKKWNADIDSKKYYNKEDYPNAKPEEMKKIPEEMFEDLKDEYITVFGPVLYDKEHLYLTAHY